MIMATEYRLSHTAVEIDEKLTKVGELDAALKTKQDNLTFDFAPTEDSENPITSGGVYAALQNVSGSVESVNGKTGIVELTADDIGALPNTTVIPTVPENISEFSNDAGYITSEALENKQDKLTFDVEPSEGSENPITSGGVYNALQNVGGGTDLIAGDFIEIKDGVVRCTLGDLKSGGTKEVIDEKYGTHVLEMENEEGLYINLIPINTHLPSTGDVLEVLFTPLGATEPIHFTTEVVPFWVEDGETYVWSAGCNATLTLDMEFTIIDETLPAFFLAFTYDDGEIDAPIMQFASSENYTGATLTVGTKTTIETKEYVLLPDTALGFGREIETEVNDEIVNVNGIEMIDEGVYITMFDVDSLPENGTILDIAFTLPGETEPVVFNAEVTEFFIEGDFVGWISCCNATVDEYGNIAAIDESVPAFIIQMIYDDGEIDCPIMVMASAVDYSGASITISTKVVKKIRVTLPNEALNFDTEPTEGSTNLVNSGDIYNAIQNIKPDLAYDAEPTQGSDNLVTSGAVYNTIQDVHIAIQNAKPNLVYDAKPMYGSNNLVTSGTIYDMIGDIDAVISEINSRIGGAS